MWIPLTLIPTYVWLWMLSIVRFHQNLFQLIFVNKAKPPIIISFDCYVHLLHSTIFPSASEIEKQKIVFVLMFFEGLRFVFFTFVLSSIDGTVNKLKSCIPGIWRIFDDFCFFRMGTGISSVSSMCGIFDSALTRKW